MTSLQAPSLLRSRWFRILGVSFVMYVMSYIDRTNIAMAIPSMREELGMSPAAIGFATSMFFWGYIVLQIPTGRLASVWSPKWVIFGLLILWSGASLTTAFVHTEGELIVNRFLLGIAEGGVLTCTLVLIRNWFTKPERARANACFLLSLAVAPMIAGPISGLILSVSDWRMMFILEALPSLLWAVVWIWAIQDSPRDAAWIDPDERMTLLATLEAERVAVGVSHGHWLKTLWHPSVLLLAAYNFLALMAEWGVNFWLPTLLKDTGLTILWVGLLAGLPYGLGVVAMLVVARSSDRLQERKWHMIAATAIAGLTLLALPAVAGSTLATICMLSISIGLFYGRFGPFWTLPSEVLPPAVIGVGIGVINGAGNLGGTVGPFFFGYVRTQTGSFTLALAVAGVSLILGALVAWPIKAVRRAAPSRDLPAVVPVAVAPDRAGG